MSQNHDPQELAKFAALASHWWDISGELKTLHQINPLRLNYITEKCPVADKTILDIGCGGGILTESLSKLGAIVTGIDMNTSLIDVAKLHQLESETDAEYIHTSAESYAAQCPAIFDIVTCFEMLEHVPDPASIVKSVATLLKPGGCAFFSTLNRNPKSYLYAILGAEYMLRLLPKNTHDYAKFLKPSELSQMLRNARLTPEDVSGIAYNPFTEEFHFSEDVSVNYLLYAIKSS